MRIALCLSGHMRSFEHTIEFLRRELIEPNNADVFISTWDVTGQAKHEKWESEKFQEKLDVQKVHDIYGDCLKSLVVHDFNQTQASLVKCFYQGMVSMFWQVKMADQQRLQYEAEQGCIYDVVIRSRPDLILHNGIQIVDREQIGESIFACGNNPHYLPDFFAFGNRRVMQHYSSIYDHLAQLEQFREVMQPPPGETCIFAPEQVLLLYLVHSGIPIVRIPLTPEICRKGFEN